MIHRQLMTLVAEPDTGYVIGAFEEFPTDTQVEHQIFAVFDHSDEGLESAKEYVRNRAHMNGHDIPLPKSDGHEVFIAENESQVCYGTYLIPLNPKD